MGESRLDTIITGRKKSGVVDASNINTLIPQIGHIETPRTEH